MTRDSFYHRIFYSPYLSEQIHHLHSTYLFPSDVHQVFERLQQDIVEEQSHHEREQLYFRPHTLGRSTSGQHTLIGWTLGHPQKPRILCASQHHGPENIGPSFCFYLSYLLLKDPLFQPWLKRYSFSFFPQQNPEGLTVQGNHKWMQDPHWEKFVHFHQYDPRQWDVEHGVLSSWFDKQSLLLTRSDQAYANSFRTENLGLVQWIEQETSLYGPICFYLSGHSWDLLDAPLYLVYPNQNPESQKSQSWAQAIWQLTENTPYTSLTSHAPLTEEYVLPKWNAKSNVSSTPLDGLFILPTQSAFKAQNHASSVRQSTLDYVCSTSPQVYACVVEPPIFSSYLFKHQSFASKHTLSELIQAINAHQAIVDQLTRALSSFIDHNRSISLEQIYASISQPLRRFTHPSDLPDREFIRLICELKERQNLKAQWEKLLTRLQAESCSPLDQLTEGQLHLARANQVFHASNLLALSLRVFNNLDYLSKHTAHVDCAENTKLIKSLAESFESSLKQLSSFKLQHWPISHGCFVYLNALWAYIDGDELMIDLDAY